eukprot:TRINITY_DN589_c0_g1_i1.p1 TRINITY_DN589_c0_g1~~TRINITY_DN589_c0_g1_i1.p1  ORF type:complete len:349 (+),score=91.38 TRINITY_DN589_c0_g1_i1:56-1048(+)
MASLGVIAHVANENPRFVPVSAELLSCCLSDVANAVRRAISTIFGFGGDGEEEDFRLLFRDRDLKEERSAAAFTKSLGGGMPCAVRVIFSLLGGKGGFGALLRKQMGQGKKTTNFDAMRDLSGRRLRHAKAVERIKGWMEQKKRDDELVNLIVGEGPDLPKPVDASESLDPEYLRKLKQSAASLPSLVDQGIRRLSNEDRANGEHEPKKSRRGVEADWLMASGAYGTFSSPEAEDDSADDGDKGASASTAAAAAPLCDAGSGSTSSNACAAAAVPAALGATTASAAASAAPAAMTGPAAIAAAAEDDEDGEDKSEAAAPSAGTASSAVAC